MKNLFDNTDKLVRFQRHVSQQLQIKTVLNPYTHEFVDESLANQLGILFDGYYRNRYGGLIPLHIAASKGFIQFTVNDQIECEQMEIEYRSRQAPLITNLIVHQVYDAVSQTMIPFQQAIDLGYLDLEFFSYASANFTMSIHDAFSRGFILGELRTSSTSTPAVFAHEKRACEYDYIFSSMTNIINSLSEFRNTIQISDACELTADGFIKEKATDKCHLLTQAIELGLIAIADLSSKFQCNDSQNHSTLVNESHASDMDISYADQTTTPELHAGFFSDTFILDLFKSTGDHHHQQEEMPLTTSNRFLPVMNTC